RQVTWFRPLEDAVYVARRAPVHVQGVRAVGDEPPVLDVGLELIEGRQAVAGSMRNEHLAVCGEDGAGEREKGLRARVTGGPEGALVVANLADLDDLRREAQLVCGRGRGPRQRRVGTCVPEEDDPGECGQLPRPGSRRAW